MRLALLPLALLLAATPAVAQINGSRQASAAQRERGAPMARDDWSGELAMIDRDAREERAAGRISRREARSIRRQTGLVRSLGSSYAAHGLSDAELAFLEAQVFAVRDLARAPNRPAPPRRGR
ncbi:MAG TPA: hypothetical protein VMG08_15700 [Allosphingosinicella sp.]|nr:hypothetical protein [Allosphingosinicella sp.]